MDSSLPRRAGRFVLTLSLALAPAAGAQVLAGNLTYTTLKPCRLADTRVAGGALIPGTPRTFNVVGVGAPGSLASQGGNSNGCPVPGFVSGVPAVQAVMLNFVAVGPAGGGDLRAWPSDQALPTSSVINFSSFSETVLNIANGIAVPVRQDSQGADITVQADARATQLVIDVVGYFSYACQQDCAALGASFTCFKGSCVNQICSGSCPTPPDAIGANCVGGFCVPTGCVSGFFQCGNSCVNVASDPDNCSACGRVCPLPPNAVAATCNTGVCSFNCGTLTKCQGICTDLATDPNHCGACGNACISGDICSAGACSCPSGNTICTSVCTNTQTDPNNCGFCGNVCSGGTPSCVSGTCQ